MQGRKHWVLPAIVVVASLIACSDPDQAASPVNSVVVDPTIQSPTVQPTTTVPTAIVTPTAVQIAPTDVPLPTITPTSSPSLPTQPPPTPVISDTPTPQPTLTPAPTPTEVVEPTSVIETPTPTVVPTKVPTPTVPTLADVSLGRNRATVEFVDEIKFELSASDSVAVDRVQLEYGFHQTYVCGSTKTSVNVDFVSGKRLEASWNLDTGENQFVPPGARVWWRWVLLDAGNDSIKLPVQEITYEDSRYTWTTITRNNITLHWNTGGANFGPDLLDLVDEGLSRLEFPPQAEEPIEAYVYGSAAEVRSAVPGVREWTGGLAFGSHSIVLMGIPPSSLQSTYTGLTHEFAHLRFNALTFNCLADTPRWLNEGLAVYAEGPISASDEAILNDAVTTGNTFSITSISTRFPAAHGEASLAYAESVSIVDFMVRRWGWDSMNQLLQIFGEGSTTDSALVAVYDLDRSELFQEWLADIQQN